MPRRKPKPEKIVQEQIKNTLDSILMDENLDSDVVTPDALPRLKTTDIMNFSEATQTTGTQARGLLDSMVKFYLEENLIDQSDYIDYKKKIDSANVSSMMLQLKTAQHAITKLLEEIDMGNANPRMFEVLAQLQSQIMQMPKDYQNYMEKMEESYRRTGQDLEKKINSGSISLDQSGNIDIDPLNPTSAQTPNSGLKVRGTKSLMEGLRDILGAEIEDVKPIEENENSVVNAKKKAEIDASRNILLDEDDKLEIDEDLFS
jgi:hypothetical protein